MNNEISTDLFTVFFLSVLKRIIKENPEAVHEECMRLGKATGERLNEDFYAKLGLFRRLKDTDAEKQIGIFFKHYFGASVVLENGFILLKEPFFQFAGESGSSFFCGVLSAVFKPLNEHIVFSVQDDGLKYEFKAAKERA